MAYLLAIETATKVCSVALFKDQELLALKEEKGDYSHAENLAVFTEEILQQCDVLAKDLSAIIVSKGPGSYTGLRIGVSFAKGLCYSLKIPLVSIDTLNALALGWAQENISSENLICSMIDARRMEVYSAIYDGNLNCIKPISADIIDKQSYTEIIKNNPIVFIGDGAAKCEPVLKSGNRSFYHDFVTSASYLGPEGFKKFQQSQFEDVAYFEPYYLKDFVAIKSKKGSLG